MSTLVVEPCGGIAGDMFLAALCALGDPRFGIEELRGLARELVPGEAQLELTRVKRGGLAAAHLSVRSGEAHAHRNLAQLTELLAASSLPPRALERARGALVALAQAEARVHGVGVEEVHFHEVGAVDTLIDLGGAALALERLGVTRLLASEPLLGEGSVECAHGILPVPVPAVSALLEGRRVVRGGGFERTTPTGAAILAAWTEELRPGTSLVAGPVGYGAGTREASEGPPNLLRVELCPAPADGRDGEESGGERWTRVWELAVNLDDMTPQDIGFALGELREAGALEAWAVPVQMKKDRPGVVLCALCRDAARQSLERAVFRTTSTLGLRWTVCERRELARRTIEVELDGFTIRVKVRGDDPGPADYAPEYDDLVRAARLLGVSPWVLRRRAIEASMP